MSTAILLSLALAVVFSLRPGAVAASPQSQSAASVSSPHLQANGVEMESNGVHLKITALREGWCSCRSPWIHHRRFAGRDRSTKPERYGARQRRQPASAGQLPD